MTQKEKLLYIAALIFLTSLFFSEILWFRIVGAAALVICSLFFNSFKEKWALLKERKYIQGMILFFLVVVVSVFLSDNHRSALHYLDPRLALFYLPVTVGLLNLRKAFRDKVLLGFAAITTLVCILCLGTAIHKSGFFRHQEFLYNDALTGLIDQQSIYIALLVNLSIYIFGYHIFYKQAAYKGFMILAVLFLFGISYLLASRIMLAVLLASVVGFAFYYVVRHRKVLEGATLLLGIFIGAFIIFKFFPKTINRFKELTYTSYSYQNLGKESHYNMQLDSTQWNGANFRMAAWKCGWELFQQHPVMGVHIGDKHDRLFEIYRRKNFLFAIQTNKNVHSNYLDVLYSLGIVGFVAFLIGWIVLPVFFMWKYKDGLSFLILLTFASAWVTEIYFDRNLGGILTGFFIPFLLAGQKETEDDH